MTASSAMPIARGMVRAGSRTSSPRVAMRAYPAKAKKMSAADCRSERVGERGVAAGRLDDAGDDDDREDDEDPRHEDGTDARGAGHAEQVHPHEGDHRDDGDGLLPF